jgi:hypothetical protein
MLLKLVDRRFLFFISSFLYALGICFFGQTGDSLLTIIYLFLFTVVFLNLQKRILSTKSLPNPLIELISFQIFISLGILLGLYLGSGPNSILWPLDAIYTHVPLSQNIMQALQGIRTWNEVSIEIPGALTHSFTGLWFYFIGPTIYASGLSLLCFKIATILFIFLLSQSLYDTKTAYISSLIYIIAPTVQFYTLNFYKEATIHFLIISSFYFSYSIFFRQKFLFLPALGLSLFLLSQERFYLVFLFIPTLFIFMLFASKNYRLLKLLIFSVTIGVLVKNNVYLQQSPEWMFHKLEEFRQSHMQFHDFSFTYNYEIPYYLAYVKTLFTPYFTFKKLLTFLDLGNLLTWGSFLNQGIILSSLYAMIISLKKDWKVHLGFILPFLILIAFLAYISPWSGRIRDSFYPIIVIYAGLFFSQSMYKPILNRFKKLFTINSQK